MSSATTNKQTASRYHDYSRKRWQRWLLTRETAVIFALILVILVASGSVDYFASDLTVRNMLRDVAPYLLIALPMTMIIITAEIDLSVGSMVGLSAVVTGQLFDSGVPYGVAALIAVVVGVAGGALNGILITVMKLPSLAVTIGTFALFRGLAKGFGGNIASTQFPQDWRDVARSTTEVFGAPIPNAIFVILVLAIIFGVVLHHTPFGRGIFASGQSAEAARFSGIRVDRTKLILFVVSGTVSAIAGVYYTLFYNTARGDVAQGYELAVIAAVLLGGVSIFGGRGALHGPIAAVLLIGILNIALQLQGVTSDIFKVITGALLVASVVFPSLLTWFRSSGARRERRGPAVRTPV